MHDCVQSVIQLQLIELASGPNCRWKLALTSSNHACTVPTASLALYLRIHTKRTVQKHTQCMMFAVIYYTLELYI
jgi:hypothetical protein